MTEPEFTIRDQGRSLSPDQGARTLATMLAERLRVAERRVELLDEWVETGELPGASDD